MLLPSCIEGEEEIWVNADASGKARFEVTAPTLLFNRYGGTDELIADAKAGAAQSQNISLTTIEAESKGTRTTFRAEVTFEDARELGGFLKTLRDPPDSPEPCMQEILVGGPDLKIAFPNLSFHRELDVRSLVPPEGTNPMVKRLLGDAQLSYHLHLPTAVTSHNADVISKDRKSLQWNVPITELLEGPVEMNFVAPVPHFSRYLLLAAVALFFFLVLALLFWKKRLKSQKKS